VYGAAVVTLLTVQNTRGVTAIQTLAPEFVLAQLDAVVADIPPTAAKFGALGSAALIEALAERIDGFGFPVVVDPVMISKHGHPLLAPEAVDALRRRLLPRAWLVTPNLREAAALAEMDIRGAADLEQAAIRIGLSGARHVLVKGGALAESAVDVLWSEGETHRFATPRIETRNLHGAGCAYSAAITARLANGEALLDAVQRAKTFITAAIASSPGLGAGTGPLNLHALPDRMR
jgi:hydroxymethylpyrimidine/phosphomethylpyrimidine kinase